LYRQHADGLRGLAYLMTGVREAAEEIVHDAFVRVHGRYAALDAPVAYLRTTVVNLCLDWQRRSAMERQRTVGLVERPAGPVEIDETWDLLAELPQDQRVVAAGNGVVRHPGTIDFDVTPPSGYQPDTP
jgi:DNA-directed RNA polymerase specialized sigma24 family protein